MGIKFECPWCNAPAFSKKDKLTTHMRIHNVMKLQNLMSMYGKVTIPLKMFENENQVPLYFYLKNYDKQKYDLGDMVHTSREMINEMI